MTMQAATRAFDVSAARKDFPILDRKVHGKPLVYLDNAATSQKPRSVIDALTKFYTEYNANIHRGVHFLSQQASEAYDAVRGKVQRFIHAGTEREVVFTRGTTESVNLVASSFLKPRLSAGDVVLVSAMEHHSNIVPWQMACEACQASVQVIPMDDTGTLDLEAYRNLLTPAVKLVAVVHTSNSLGTVNPVTEMTALAHEQGIPVLVDGAQAVAHGPVDVQEMGCDFFAFSSHKMLGPTGTGVLWAREDLLESMPPYQGGGDMIASVSFEKTTYNEIPFRFEAGTQNVADVIAFGAAIDYWNGLDRAAAAAHEKNLLAHATSSLESMNGIRLIGRASAKAAVVSFVAGGINALDLGMYLDTQGIALRTGHHCTEPVMDFYGIPGTLRVSYLFYNTNEETDLMIRALDRGISLLSG